MDPDSTQTLFVPGAQVGPYKIEAAIGAGGMGQVFRALDTRLNRPVAIKVSHKPFDPRFEREARAIAQLNHPNICTLHDVGLNYLVMELVEGETLSARIKKGALPMDLVIRYGAQIADALSAAHAKGITHRDLKPGNIMVTKAGVKVLDFGLAKLQNDETLTMEDAVMGTPAYMAPEQREGKECDGRSDIYALGLILREMATGKRNVEIPGSASPFSRTVAGCLEADPADRWQSASDIKKQLEWSAPVAITAPSSKLPWMIAAAATFACLLAVGALMRKASPVGPGTSQFTMSLGDIGVSVILSPDGRTFAYTLRDSDGGPSLWIRPLDSVEARRLAGTERATAPFWSPDGKWVGFFAAGQLKKVSPAGGPPQVIAAISSANAQDAVWGPGGDILFRMSNREPLSRVADSGGSARPVTTLNTGLTENSHRYPQFLPDGRHFLYVSRCADPAKNALYLASLDSPERKRIISAESQVRFVPARYGQPDLLFYYRDGALVAREFDPTNGEVTGEPRVVVDKIAYNAPSIFAFFSISRDGSVIVTASASVEDRELSWVQRDGTKTGTLGPRAGYYQIRLSPDQSRVLFSQPDPQTGNRDIFYMELARGIISRVTTNVANDWDASWSPDGRQVLFGSDRTDGRTLPPYIKASVDTSSTESRVPAVEWGPPYDWSLDGRWIVGNSQDIWIASPSGASPPFPFLATPAIEGFGRFSPDGKWIAYVSNESGRSEVYARPFDGRPAGPAGKVRLSDSGGEFSIWGPTGQELFYMRPDATIVAVDTRGLGKTDSVPPPMRLFQACPGTKPFGAPNNQEPYAWPFDTRDGKRFLVNCTVEPPGKFTILMNWTYPAQ